MYQKLTLQNMPKPTSRDLVTETYWLCETLGLSSGRDTENLTIQIVLAMLDIPSIENGISSEQLAKKLNLSVGRINHHIRNLHKSGFIYRDKRLIYLRGNSLKESVRELRKDAERILDELETVAADIDLMMGMKAEYQDIYNPHALLIPDHKDTDKS